MTLPLTTVQLRCLTTFGIALMIACLTCGCASSVSPDPHHESNLAGFWSGLMHGLIIPLAWVISLLGGSVAIYAINNNGAWYDFGFVLGLFFLAKFLFESSTSRFPE